MSASYRPVALEREKSKLETFWGVKLATGSEGKQENKDDTFPRD